MKVIWILFLLTCFTNSIISQTSEKLFFGCGQTEAQYPGGLAALQQHYCKMITKAYEKNQEKNPVEGVDVITFTIDTIGNAKSEYFRRTIRSDIDSMLANAITSSMRWIPATQGGQKVVSYKTQKFTFSGENYGTCGKSVGFVCR